MPHLFYKENLQLITDKATHSGSEIAEKSAKLANFLEIQGTNSGDHVVVLTDDQATILTCASACYESGFVLVCLDPSLGVEQVTAILKILSPKAILADLSVLQKLKQAESTLPNTVLDTSSRSSVCSWLTAKTPHWPMAHTVFSSSTPNERVNRSNTIDEQQAAYIMFTSGSTGEPKGVVITRSALQKHVNTLCEVFDYNSDSRLLSFLPAYHTDGLVHCCYVPLFTGMSVIRPGTFTVSTNFESKGLVHNATHFLAVPTILWMLHDLYSDKPDLFKSHGTHTVISTASVLEKAFTEKFNRTFGIQLYNFYGLTETVSGALYCNTSILPADSLGTPVGVDARLVKNGIIINECQVEGELQLRGDQLMQSYYKNPQASAQAFDGEWFKTGDLFTLDEYGQYYFKGRLKDIINKGGVSIYPQAVRNHIINHPMIADCEIIGMPDSVFEEVIVACYVSQETLNLSELTTYCKTTLANEMQPDHWVKFETLPRTSVGKINKPELTRKLQQIFDSSQSAENTDITSIEKNVLNLAASVFKTDSNILRSGMGKDQISGWDSYAHLKFIKQIEKTYSIRLKARDIMRLETLKDAITLIKVRTTHSEAA